MFTAIDLVGTKKSAFSYLAVRQVHPKETAMRKYLVAAVVIGAFATPALAVDTGGGHYFVGLDTSSHTCSVVTEMPAGMKMMGEYDSQEAAEAAMADMAECKG